MTTNDAAGYRGVYKDGTHAHLATRNILGFNHNYCNGKNITYKLWKRFLNYDNYNSSNFMSDRGTDKIVGSMYDVYGHCRAATNIGFNCNYCSKKA